MKQFIIALILFIFVIGGAFILKPQTSHCAGCVSAGKRCMSDSACYGQGCFCG